jgi:hypothetical protein
MRYIHEDELNTTVKRKKKKNTTLKSSNMSPTISLTIYTCLLVSINTDKYSMMPSLNCSFSLQGL